RIVAWCAALSTGGWDPALARRMRVSLWRQLRYLRRRVEHDIGGNHVLENACALIVGGACTADARAMRHGRLLLARELPRQVLSDGGHEERSPSYHRLLLERLRDVQEILARSDEPPLDALDAAVTSMQHWMQALAGPDGALPLLNDAWAGPPIQSGDAAVDDLTASGYVVLRAGSDQAVLDVGPLSPSHLPPHAHADALSFVLWMDGRPVVVDPGSGAYDGEARAWSRSTAAHNTVEVDGADQCVFLGPFRAARLPRVWRTPVEQVGDAVVVRAGHDGYGRLNDSVEVRRTFCWLPGDGLVIVDRLCCEQPHRVMTPIHLAAGLEPGKTPVTVRELGPGPEPTERRDRVAPYLGRFDPAVVLERRMEAQPGVPFGWALLRSDASVRIEGTILQIHRGRRADVVVELA
ncbi:MAG: hypothetical protein QOJ72_1702, partial [Nocardioidaceae bacterium]|nr:hypothetical protein [Nocardioidaceae bacterium]